MIGVQAIFAAVTRSLGKLLNTAFGWATILLFGKVPQDRQIYLSVITFGSVIWLVAVLGTAFPAVGTWLLTFVKLPRWVRHDWIRLAMLGAVVLLPLAVGVASLLMLTPDQRPTRAAARAKLILRGYPYTVGLGLTLVMLLVFAPILKVRNILRRWTDRHVPVIVESGDYLEVVDAIHAALAAGGIDTRRVPASWLIRMPTSLLTAFARDETKSLVADRLTTLTAPDIEVLLHPSDLVLSGQEREVAYAQAVISERLTYTKAHLTWDKEANDLEDRLYAIWQLARTDGGRAAAALEVALVKLGGVHADLQRLKLPYEEWEVLFRELTVMQRTVLDRLRQRSRPAPSPSGLDVLCAALSMAARARRNAGDDGRAGERAVGDSRCGPAVGMPAGGGDA